MPSAKSGRSRHKLSFAVDRSEIDISSDWVQAVMQRPSPPPPAAAEPETPVFSSPETQNATVEPVSTVEAVATVEDTVPVENKSTDAENTTGALFEVIDASTVAENATVISAQQVASTVELNPTVAEIATVADNSAVEVTATVAKDVPVAKAATVAPSHRNLRLRPIHRITDGLTPGQYSVYSLMFEKGEPQNGRAGRLFRGGYVDLVRLTGLSKRGIQNVIAELQSKSVISIYQQPGYHRSQTTIYEVPAEQTVLDRWFAQGLRYAVGKSKNLITIATVE